MLRIKTLGIVGLVVAVGLWGAGLGTFASLAPVVSVARAELPEDEHGVVDTVPGGSRAHRLWVGDRIFRHSILFDGDTGRVLGMVDITWTLGGETPYLSPNGEELYVIEPVYSRGHRGERTDYITIYDASTLAVTDEIELPKPSATIGHGFGLAAVLDDGRFLVVFHQAPATSVSIVDLEARKFVAEVSTAGCALVYPAGPRRFATLCGDGTALAVTLDESGGVASTVKSPPFFNAIDSPVIDKGVRSGTRWLFSTFDGELRGIDFENDEPRVLEAWSMTHGSGVETGWVPGGVRLLAYHEALGRLYVLVHEGEPGSHKKEGESVWVYDVAKRERVQVIDVPNLLAAFIKPYAEIEDDSWTAWIVDRFLPNLGAHSIAVTQDDRPLLFFRHELLGAIGVADAITGEHLRDLTETGIGGGMLRTVE